MGAQTVVPGWKLFICFEVILNSKVTEEIGHNGVLTQLLPASSLDFNPHSPSRVGS